MYLMTDNYYIVAKNWVIGLMLAIHRNCPMLISVAQHNIIMFHWGIISFARQPKKPLITGVPIFVAITVEFLMRRILAGANIQMAHAQHLHTAKRDIIKMAASAPRVRMVAQHLDTPAAESAIVICQLGQQGRMHRGNGRL